MIFKGLDGIEMVHIDLSYNCISDSGVECLADCLKVCVFLYVSHKYFYLYELLAFSLKVVQSRILICVIMILVLRELLHYLKHCR